MTKYEKYNDYVIKNGKFIGEFETMYKDFEDPWEQTKREKWSSDKAIAINWCKKLQTNGKNRVMELGCGAGQFTNNLKKEGIDVMGIDISNTAINKARRKFPQINFEVADILDYEIYEKFKPDIIIMPEITWYILEKLKDFLNYMKREFPDIYIIHLLTTYGSNEQKYGREFFTDLDGIMKFFNMKYHEYGEITQLTVNTKRTFFVGTFY